MNDLKHNFLKLIILPVVAVTLAMLASSLALAQEGARVYAQPVESAEGLLTVDVIAENVTEMYGAEFQLNYDPAMLSVRDSQANQEGLQVAPGTLLSVDQGFVVANNVDETAGSIVFAMTLLNPAPPVNGSGPLARITFNVLQEGPTTLNVERAKLVAFDLQTIPSQTEALTVENSGQAAAAGGSESQPAPADAAPVTVAQTPSSAAGENEFPWWIVAAAVLILGVLALGGFIIMGGLNPSSPAPAGQARPQVSGPSTGPARPRRTRPSAFKN